MSKKHFTEKEIEILSNNPYVKSVSSKGVTYTDEFKRIFIAEMKMENCQDRYSRRMVLILKLLVL